MMGDKKKTLAAILGDPDEKKKAAMPSDSLDAISEELIDAVHSKDAIAVSAALRAAYAECGSASESESEE